MSIYIEELSSTQTFNELLCINLFGGRDPEDAQSTTIGGLSDLPQVHPGTIDQALQDILFYLSDPDKYLGYEAIPTGTSIMTESFKIRFPVIFKYEIKDQEMIQLERTAKNRDERTFIEVANNMGWDIRSPGDILRGIQFAFEAGAHFYARRLATAGAERFPEHQDLLKYVKILAPPEVIQRNLPSDPTLRSNRDWLKTHRDEYKGQWVALQNGELLESAPHLRDLKNVRDRTEGILFTRVA